MRNLVLILNFVALSVALVTLTTGQTVKADPIPGDKIGIVLLHGKVVSTSRIESLADDLRDAGALVEMPEINWFYRSYTKALLEIDDLVKRLKSKGAKRIIVGGHSLGANVSLGYAATREGLSGIILLAYGHVPSGGYFTKKLRASVSKAKAMIEAGDGKKQADFDDINQRQRSSRSLLAENYYSWFSPDGPASDKKNARNVKSGTPVLWVSGDEDRISKFGKRLVYSKIPDHPKNKFEIISSDHVDTPSDAVETVIKWLSQL